MLEHGWRPLAYGTIRYFAAIVALLGLHLLARALVPHRPGRHEARAPRGVDDLPQPALLRLRPEAGSRLDRGPAPRHDAHLHRADLASRSGSSGCSTRSGSAPALTFGGVALIALATEASAPASGGPARDRNRVDVGLLHGVDRAAACGRYSPYRISSLVLAVGWIPLALVRSPPGRGAAVLVRMEGVARLRLRGRRAALPHDILWFTAIDPSARPAHRCSTTCSPSSRCCSRCSSSRVAGAAGDRRRRAHLRGDRLERYWRRPLADAVAGRGDASEADVREAVRQ